MKLNGNYNHLDESYLFAGIAAKVRQFKEANPALTSSVWV